MKRFNILFINGSEHEFEVFRKRFSTVQQSNNYMLSWCNSYENAINAMLKSQYDAYLVFYRLGIYTGIDLLNEAVKSNVDEPIILIDESADYDVDMKVMKSGASGYFDISSLDVITLERTIRYSIHRAKAMRAVKESEKKFRIIFEKSPDPIVITDSNGTIHDINPAGEKLFGVSRIKSLKGNSAKHYKNGADRTALISLLEKKGMVSNFITDLVTANGEIRRCSVSSFLQISQHGNTELFHSIIHDISACSH